MHPLRFRFQKTVRVILLIGCFIAHHTDGIQEAYDH